MQRAVILHKIPVEATLHGTQLQISSNNKPYYDDLCIIKKMEKMVSKRTGKLGKRDGREKSARLSSF